MTDEEFWNHLGSVNGNVVLLVIVDYYNPTTLQTEKLYLSNKRYSTSPTDTIQNICFDDAITVDTHQLVTSVSLPNPTENRLEIMASTSIDELPLINTNGYYDYLFGCVFDGHNIDIYIGDVSFPFSEFRLMKKLIGSSMVSKGEFSAAIQFSSLDGKFNTDLQKRMIVYGPSSGNPLPIAFGTIFRASPVYLGINPSTGKKRYKLNEYPIKSILRVEDNGVNITGYVTYLGVGEFELNTEPSGTLTVNFEGTYYGGSISGGSFIGGGIAGGTFIGGTFINTAAKIAKFLVLEKSYDIIINEDSYDAFEIACPQPLGVYITQRINFNELLDNILNSVLGFKYFKNSNEMYLGYFALNTVTDPLEITDEFIKSDGGIQMSDALYLPLANVKISYKKNFTPSETAASSLSSSQKQEIKLSHSTFNSGMVFTDLKVVTIAPDPTNPTNPGLMTVYFDSPSLTITGDLTLKVKVGDILAIYLGVSEQNHGYYEIVTVMPTYIVASNPTRANENSISATCSILTQSNIYKMFKNPISSDVRETFLVDMEDARDQGIKLQQYYGQIRRLYDVEIFGLGIVFDLFQHVRLVYPRYNMSGGVDAWVVSCNNTPYTQASIKLRVFI